MTIMEARASADTETTTPGQTHSATETLGRPYRLGVVGLGAAAGLFVRLAVANGLGDLSGRGTTLTIAATSLLVGVGLLLVAGERDQCGVPVLWMALVTTCSWATFNWLSPPFADSVSIWSEPDQTVLAALGAGNGLLLAGILSLAFVRRAPTSAVVSTLFVGVLILGANTVLLRAEWPAIGLTALGFALVLAAWDRVPRQEPLFARPSTSPRISRAAMSLASVALCGAAIQAWTSRNNIPRATPALVSCALLLLISFSALLRVRRELEHRSATLNEWAAWMREIRRDEFRKDMVNYGSTPPFEIGPLSDLEADFPEPGVSREWPRLSFPNLTVDDELSFPTPSDEPDPRTDDLAPTDPALTAPAAPKAATLKPADPEPATAEPATAEPATTEPADPEPATAEPADPEPATTEPAEPEPATAETTVSKPSPLGSMAADSMTTEGATQEPVVPEAAPSNSEDCDAREDGVGTTSDLAAWLTTLANPVRPNPLLIAIEAMPIAEFDLLSERDRDEAPAGIGGFLGNALPNADLIAWIDGPYFIVAHTAVTNRQLVTLNTAARAALRPSDGTLAMLRPATGATLEEIVDAAVEGLMLAHQAKGRLR